MGFKTKKDSLGNIERYKDKLVAKGFTQKKESITRKLFSVSKKDSLRIILALVAHFDLELQQMDVKTTFLNGELEEEVYMKQPEGFPLVMVSESKVCFLVLYVADILLATDDKGLLHEVKQFLSKNFDMKDMGEASYVIGIKIHRDRFQGILVSFGLRVMDSISRPLSIYCDNSAAVFMAKNNKSGSRSKHIDIKYLAIRERVKEKKVVIEHISTELMIIDPLTKGMPPLKFKDHVVNMGLIPLCSFYCINSYYDVFSY
ncbi:Retrovirus-related Pol polyprotein from transposon TNT 1-94 [Vitis vinifera]|uniref:Retrovirus-related Pol polyprotein from transposon TNT 1-94 n=1 Tax=Vitis vinifera TaxID=29760 RepID=A0A438J704_VITVI|nr:Retrovirus-related Pol polyprotein from transposon TNT 1-94 [Vitis vinifera]